MHSSPPYPEDANTGDELKSALEAAPASRRLRAVASDERVAALIDDIDSFDFKAAAATAELHSRTGSVFKTPETVFPLIDPGAAEGRGNRLLSLSAKPGVGAASFADEARHIVGGVLADLRRAVESRQHALDGEEERRARLKLEMDQRLRWIFEYSHDLAQNLNLLKLPIPRHYFILNPSHVMRDLHWVEGFADIRSRSEKEGGGLERVLLGYTLRGSGSLKIERFEPLASRVRSNLIDLGVRFDFDDRKRRGVGADVVEITIHDEVKVFLCWRADLETGNLLFDCQNFDSLGFRTYAVDPHGVDAAFLDSFGSSLIGRKSNFFTLLTRTA